MKNSVRNNNLSNNIVFKLDEYNYSKSNDHIRCLRQQLLSVLNRLCAVVEIKKVFNFKEVQYLKRFKYKVVEDLLYLCFYHKKAGFAKFKEKINFVIHWILLSYPDPNIIFKGRIPRWLRSIRKLCTSEARTVIILSFLNIYRVVKFPVSLNISDITNPYLGSFDLGCNDENSPFGSFKLFYEHVCTLVKNRYVNNSLITSERVQCDLRVVSGPNGSPAVNKIEVDYNSIISTDSFSKLYYFNNGCLWDTKDYFVLIRGFSEFSSREVRSKKVGYTSRLSLLQDKGGKTRNIAIGDYFTQISMKPLHNIIFKILRRFSTDGTHNQDRQCKSVYRALLSNERSPRTLGIVKGYLPDVEIENKFYSIDMKSCTERFPVEIQRLCLVYTGLLTEELSVL